MIGITAIGERGRRANEALPKMWKIYDLVYGADKRLLEMRVRI